ncbi:MAG TPA: hypothetical protein VJ750_10380 [Rhizomicrobium sp.]|nr:hypothetical protein [Rhizomicrobium sp.]
MRVIKWLWDRLGDAFTARDLYYLIVGVFTVIGTVLPPLGFWLATPASPQSLIIIALIGGVLAFFVAIRLAPDLPDISPGLSPKPDLRSLRPSHPTPPIPRIQVSAPMGKSLSPLPLLPLDLSKLPQDKIAPWLKVNTFTVAQAASLWADANPGLSFSFDKGQNPAIAAAEQLIITELRDKLDLTHATLARIGDYSGAYVHRVNLIELAMRKNVAPKFLAKGPGWP